MPLPTVRWCRLRAGLDFHRAEPSPNVSIGERARIKLGPLAGFEGIVVRTNNGVRVVLTVQLIMKSVRLKVEECDLELLGNQLC